MVATTLDLRYKTHDLLASLSRGVEVVITYRGKKTGRLVPYREEKAAAVGGKAFSQGLQRADPAAFRRNRQQGNVARGTVCAVAQHALRRCLDCRDRAILEGTDPRAHDAGR